MLFGTKKETNSSAQREKALALINDAFADMESATDGAFMEAYILGAVELAYKLELVTMNERAEYAERAHTKRQEIKAKGEPVYKKKGVYEYNGYNILKDFAVSSSSCWCVKKIGAEELIAKDLTFKDAVKVVDSNG